MRKRHSGKYLTANNVILVIIVASLAIIGTIIAFETEPSAQDRRAVICNNCRYDVSEKPSYTDKLLDPISLFTLVLAISTGLLWAATERLASLAETQSADMRDSIREAAKSAAAMDRMATTLTENTQLTKDIVERQKINAQAQLRAYVFINDASLCDGMRLNPPQEFRRNEPGVVMHFRNSGATPARNMISWAQIAVIDTTEEHTLVVPQLEQMMPITLAPGGTMPKTGWYGRALTPGEIQDVQTGKKGIYLYGRAEYVDCFGDRQFSNFRVAYTNAPFPPPDGVIFLHCKEGNESS